MINKIDNFEKKITGIQKYFLITVLAFMAIAMFAGVIARYIFNSPLAWTEEVLSNMQGALAFFGIGYCWHYKAHTRVLILHDKMPLKGQKILDLVSNGIIIYCLIRLLMTMPKYMKSKSSFMVSVPWLHYNVFNIFIVIGFALAVLYVFLDVLRTIITFNDPVPSEKSSNRRE